MSLTPMPSPTPVRTQEQTVVDAAWAGFLQWYPTHVTEMGALQTDVAAKQATASTAATTATTQATASAVSAAAALVSQTAAAASAASAAAVAGAFVGTSTTSLTIGSGSKSFTTQTGESYTAGIFMTAVSQANSANYMFGQVTSYSGTTLVLNITQTGGSGTLNDWNLSIAGVAGPAGPTYTGGTLATAMNAIQGSTPFHATAMDVWSTTAGVSGNELNISGAAGTLTALPAAPQAGVSRQLYLPVGTVLKHAGALTVQGAADYTTQANDIVTVHATTTTAFQFTIEIIAIVEEVLVLSARVAASK